MRNWIRGGRVGARERPLGMAALLGRNVSLQGGTGLVVIHGNRIAAVFGRDVGLRGGTELAVVHSDKVSGSK